MTDRIKIQRFFDLWEIPYRSDKKTITGTGRRFYFNEKGQLEKLIDYNSMETFTA